MDLNAFLEFVFEKAMATYESFQEIKEHRLTIHKMLSLFLRSKKNPTHMLLFHTFFFFESYMCCFFFFNPSNSYEHTTRF